MAEAQGVPFHLDGHFFWQNEDGEVQRGWEEYASDFINVAISLDPGTDPLVGTPPPNLARISAPFLARSSSVVIPTLLCMYRSIER